jgi:DNA polymerase elongation subunit (family B)
MYQNIFVNSRSKKYWLWDDEKGLIIDTFVPYAFYPDANGEYKSIYGDPLSKTTNFTYGDTHLFESDIRHEVRILIDKYGDSDIPSKNIKVMVFDIEVEMESGVPDTVEATNKVTSIAYYDSSTESYKVLVLGTQESHSAIVVDKSSITFCQDEKTLLKRFLVAMQEVKPNILTGWNILGFDIPYLVNRIKRVLGSKFVNQLSPIGIYTYSETRDVHTIAGVSCLDYMHLYKKFGGKELPSYSLNYVSNYVLGKGKIEYQGNLDTLMRDNIEKFIEYNITDVSLIVEMDAKLQFIELARGICHVGHVPYDDIMYSSKYLEGATLTYLRRHGDKKAPTRDFAYEQSDDSDDTFIGAYVKEPIPGKYDWVYDLDLTSLYPSIIMSLNISPETKIWKMDTWDFDSFVRNEDATYQVAGESYNANEFRGLLQENNLTISPNGVVYRNDIKGLLPEILEKWFEERVHYKAEMEKWGKAGDDSKYEFFKRRQLIQKILLNSLYGVLGLKNFRFYDLDNAEAITMTGRMLIQNTVKVINKKYRDEIGGDNDYVIYSDTDSCFVSCLPLVKHRYPDIDTEDTEKMAQLISSITTEVQQYVNEFYDVMSKRLFNCDKHRFEIKQEKIAKTGFWLRKKRYALWVISDNNVPVDKLEVTGLDVVRSSFPKAFQKFMTDILNSILRGDTNQVVNDMILTFVRNLDSIPLVDIAKTSSVKELSKYQKPAEKFSIGTFIKGTPSHVKGAINFNKLLKKFKVDSKYPKFRDGDKVKLVYLHPNRIGIDVIAFRGDGDPDEILHFITDNIDPKKIYESELENRLHAFYKALKWDYPTGHAKSFNDYFSFGE